MDSDAKDEYDWDAEDKKPSNEKGFERDSVLDLFRFRKMVWEKWEGRWWGRWRWTKWEDTQAVEQRIKKRRELSIRAWDAVGTPEEVLLLVVEQVASSGLAFARGAEDSARNGTLTWTASGLGNLALVCRAWYTVIAPALFSKIWVEDKLLEAPLRPTIARHARQTSVHSARPFVTSARTLARPASRPSPVVWLQWQGSDHASATGPGTAYHPSHALVYSHIHRSFSNVISFDLWHSTFLSSSDLLRLLASFPALERVRLFGVSVLHTSVSLARPRCQVGSRLQFILVDEHCDLSRLPFVTQCWTWPRRSPSDRTFFASELLHAECQLMARVSETVVRPDSKLDVEHPNKRNRDRREIVQTITKELLRCIPK